MIGLLGIKRRDYEDFQYEQCFKKVIKQKFSLTIKQLHSCTITQLHD